MSAWNNHRFLLNRFLNEDMSDCGFMKSDEEMNRAVLKALCRHAPPDVLLWCAQA